jgi:hypothetical protein
VFERVVVRVWSLVHELRRSIVMLAVIIFVGSAASHY